MRTLAYDEYRRLDSNVVLDNGEPFLKEEWDYEPEVEDEFVDDAELARRMAKLIGVSPSQFVEFAIRIPNKELQKHVPFSFKGREYLRLPYDTAAKRALYKCGRQVEKCVGVHEDILLPNGSVQQAGSIKVGDVVSTFDGPAMFNRIGRVSWVSERLKKPGLRITTRQGHSALVATTHPMRIWGDWKPAGELRVGDRIAVVRNSGWDTIPEQPFNKARIILTAYMLGDGHMGEKYMNFTSLPGAKLDEFLTLLRENGVEHIVYPKEGTAALNIRMNKDSVLRQWFKEDRLLGCLSSHKRLPNWVFDLPREDLALFLNRLWSTDGHVKRNSKSKYSIEYCSTSFMLVGDVQRMLWKFGIPTRRRILHPLKGSSAYLLRVETQDGVRQFLHFIGALGKSENVEVPNGSSNNNRDTYPIGINDLIRRIIDSRGDEGRLGCRAENSLRSAGLRETLKYPLSKEKLKLYLAFFDSDERYEQKLVNELRAHLSSSVYWDEIVDIEDVGEIDCIDFQVDETHNFVVGGMVAHNSTLLGNKCLSYCCIINAFNVLYVSPTNQQTKTFSADRLKEPIETSEILKAWTTSKLSDNVFLKKFINRSQITLRYAYHNADRTRGIPADLILIDEIQDVITDNIPVIEECASHSHFKLFIYSGTPKSTDNAIEHYWANFSTQNEWVVPCDRHGTPNTPSSWHWNVLGEDNLGEEGLICDRCEQLINPMHPMAQWASMNEGVKQKLKDYYEGYRIPQLMVPWLSWAEIRDKYTKYPRSQFYNEVLGLSYDSGTRPLTRQDVIDNCNPEQYMSIEGLQKVRNKIGGYNQVYAGIDWGTGEGSYTVIALGAYIQDRFNIFYIHRFEGPEIEPPIQLELIEKLIHYWDAKLVGCDYGGGFDRNDALARKFGKQRIVKYQYSQPGVKVKWEDGLGRYLVHRTEVMSDIFNAIKRRDVLQFPDWQQFETPFGKDMLNIFSEYNENQRQVQYKHTPGTTDDSFHAILFCFLASMIRHPRFDVLNPTQKTGFAAPED